MVKNAPKRPRDPNQLAKSIVDIATGAAQPEVDSELTPGQQLGRLGGLRGGTARAKKLSPEDRRRIAAKAAQARWGKSGRADSEDK